MFLLACAAAGALAVPPGPVSTPLATIGMLVLGAAGLHAWRWSGLQQAARGGRAILFLGPGLAVGLVLLAAIRLAIEPVLPEIGHRIATAATVPVWRRVIIIYVASVSEEVLFRLVLFSAVAGALARFHRDADRTPRGRDIWVANVLAACAFAVAHLPAWERAVPITGGVVGSVLALNAAAGLATGFVFARRGIASAIWMHAGGDAAIQLIGPLTA